MDRCPVRPYEGKEEYIFISYCHKDKMWVFPIIERLDKDGYRVWYDEGIDPGSEWPEIIAQHLQNCSACIAFISNNSLGSHNCRREINFALLKERPFISVVLEAVQMMPGMEMQLSAAQAIFKYKIPDTEEFFEKLYAAKFLKACLGEPKPDKPVHSPREYKTPVKEKPEVVSFLIRDKTNQKFYLKKGEIKMGRSSERCDYVIDGNSTIGRYHAKIINYGLRCVIVDENSMNKTYLNALQLEPGKEYLLADGDIVKLANEKFTFYQREE